MEEALNCCSSLVSSNTTQAPIGKDFSLEDLPAFDIYFNLLPYLLWSSLVCGLVGITGNILILFVFYRLGFAEAVHISYVSLAISDLFCILSIVWGAACNLPIFDHFVGKDEFGEKVHFVNLTGGLPHFAFSRTTALITAWISLERCLCVLFPTNVKVMVTRTVTKTVLAIIFIVGLFPVAFAYVGYRIEWKVDPVSNRTLLFVTGYDHNTLNPLNRIAFLLYGAVYPLFSWFTVTVCTSFLIMKLKKQVATWRKLNVYAITAARRFTHASHPGLSARNIRVTKTVVILAIVFIIATLPVSVSLVVRTLIREFSIDGTLMYPFRITFAISTLLSEFNSSLNVFIFAAVGSKFRNGLKQLLKLKAK